MKRLLANIVELEDGTQVNNGVAEMDDDGKVVRVFSLDNLQYESANTIYVGKHLKIPLQN